MVSAIIKKGNLAFSHFMVNYISHAQDLMFDYFVGRTTTVFTMKSSLENMGVVSLVFGIISLVMGVFISNLLGWLGIISAIVGIILGAIGRKNSEKKSVAIAGLVCSIVGLVLSILFYALWLLLNGSSGEPMTTTQFKTVMEENGLQVTDQSDAVKNDHSYQEVYVAYEEEKYSFEYYFMSDIDSAKDTYSVLVNVIESMFKNDEDAKVLSIANEEKSKYQVSNADYYCVAWQNENTVLYLRAYSDYKSEAKQILKELGYK